MTQLIALIFIAALSLVLLILTIALMIGTDLADRK